MVGSRLPPFLLPVGFGCSSDFRGLSDSSGFRFIESAVVDCYDGFVERKIDIDDLPSIDSDDPPTGINELKFLSKELERRPGIDRSVVEDRKIVVDLLL